MMGYPFTFFLLFISVRVLFRAQYSLWLIQVKEYRFDRLKEYFSYSNNRVGYVNIFWGLKFILLFLSFGFEFSFLIAVILFAVYLVEGGYGIIKIRRNGVFRPAKTIKILFLFLLTLFLFFGVIEYFYVEGVIIISFVATIVLLDFFAELLPFVLVLLFEPAFLLAKKYIIFKAKKKIKIFKKLIVIGITGSYGKSSTKEFLATILKEKFKVLNTPANVNTEIGIAKHILESLSSEYEIYIVEMGAYKMGEIQAICDIVKPRYGILVGINEQHISLFGSINNTIKTKFELIDALSQNGMAFVNIDNKHIQENLDKIKVPYKSISCYNKKADYFANNIFQKDLVLNFDMVINQNEKWVLQAPLLGSFNACNLLLSIALAQTVGMDKEDIFYGIKKIKAPQKTMQAVVGLNGSLIVDDSYNSNPEGTQKALDYLSNSKQKTKIAFLSLIIELGKNSEKTHIDILNKAKKVITDLVLAKNQYNFWKNILQKIDFNNNINIYWYNNKDIPDKLLDNINSNTVVLCEGRSAKYFCEQLKVN